MATTNIGEKKVPELTLWMVDDERDGRWPQGDNLIAGLSRADALAEVAGLNHGRAQGVERFVLHGSTGDPIFS